MIPKALWQRRVRRHFFLNWPFVTDRERDPRRLKLDWPQPLLQDIAPMHTTRLIEGRTVHESLRKLKLAREDFSVMVDALRLWINRKVDHQNMDRAAGVDDAADEVAFAIALKASVPPNLNDLTRLRDARGHASLLEDDWFASVEDHDEDRREDKHPKKNAHRIALASPQAPDGFDSPF